MVAPSWPTVARMLQNRGINPAPYRNHIQWVLSGQGNGIPPPSLAWFSVWVEQEAYQGKVAA